jgi:hypothetical protein
MAPSSRRRDGRTLFVRDAAATTRYVDDMIVIDAARAQP